MHSMEEIYRHHAGTVYGFLLAKTQNPDLAEELTQETFYQALRGLDTFRGESKVSSWLCGIAKHVLSGHLRKQKHDAPLAEAERIADSSAESRLFLQWDNLSVLKHLHRLREPTREVMYLRLIGNLTFAQIGEIMEQSENWARVTFYRGKEKLVKDATL